MRCVMLLASATLFFSTLGQAAGSGADDSDETKIRGAWQLVSTTKKGVETKIDAKGDDQQMVFTFEEQSWKAKVGPKGAPVEITGTYVLDPKQTPKLLDVTVRGTGGATDVYAVYKFEKDQLWIRVRDGGGQRPPDFEILADDCNTLVFRRAAK